MLISILPSADIPTINLTQYYVVETVWSFQLPTAKPNAHATSINDATSLSEMPKKANDWLREHARRTDINRREITQLSFRLF